jgi:hypothetical protein
VGAVRDCEATTHWSQFHLARASIAGGGRRDGPLVNWNRTIVDSLTPPDHTRANAANRSLQDCGAVGDRFTGVPMPLSTIDGVTRIFFFTRSRTNRVK